MLEGSSKSFSLTLDGIPFEPRPCFNWLPQYRYGQLAYQALQQACAARLRRRGDAFELASGAVYDGTAAPTRLVRPVLMDSVLSRPDWIGYVARQSEGLLETLSDGEPFIPINEDVALIVAREQGSEQLLNNILSYMIPASQSLEAMLALAGGYHGASPATLDEAHGVRKAAADSLRSALCRLYSLSDPSRLLIHSAGVGGLIEAAARYMHLSKPGYRSCILVPEYWDLLRCVLTYSPGGLEVVNGREASEFPRDAWLTAMARPGVDFSYISYTSNPLGSTVPHTTLLEAVDAVAEDALFFIDCTSVDVEQRSSPAVVADLLRFFPRKNLVVTKSFSKEYNRGHLRIGYALFSRREVAEGVWPLMAGYPPAAASREALACLLGGNAHVLEAYRRISREAEQFAASRPRIRVSGTTSNYTSLFFSTEEECSDALERVRVAYGDRVFPGELPMQGGGSIGLADGEVSLMSMRRIPFLPTNALRLLMTETSIGQFRQALDG